MIFSKLCLKVSHSGTQSKNSVQIKNKSEKNLRVDTPGWPEDTRQDRKWMDEVKAALSDLGWSRFVGKIDGLRMQVDARKDIRLYNLAPAVTLEGETVIRCESSLTLNISTRLLVHGSL